MRVRLKANVLYPLASMTPAGATLDVPDETAKNWVTRGLAEYVQPAPPKPFTAPQLTRKETRP